MSGRKKTILKRQKTTHDLACVVSTEELKSFLNNFKPCHDLDKMKKEAHIEVVVIRPIGKGVPFYVPEEDDEKKN